MKEKTECTQAESVAHTPRDERLITPRAISCFIYTIPCATLWYGFNREESAYCVTPFFKKRLRKSLIVRGSKQCIQKEEHVLDYRYCKIDQVSKLTMHTEEK